MVTIVINPKGTGKLNFARVEEHAIFCIPDIGQSVIAGIPIPSPNDSIAEDAGLFARMAEDDVSDASVAEEEPCEDDDSDGELADDEGFEEDSVPYPPEEAHLWELRHARRRGSESSYRHQRWNQFFPIFIDEEAETVKHAGDSIPLDEEPDFSPMGGLRPIWPIDLEGNHRCWRFISERMNERIKAQRVVLGRYNSAHDTWTINTWDRRKTSTKKLKTVWWDRSHDAGTHGTTLLHNILGQRATFPFPKSVYAVRDALAAVVRERPDALILDFFAGSGTTLHATCLLNAQYPGQRRSILVTNNEVSEKVANRLAQDGVEPGTPKYESLGICEAVTWPRCKYVVAGKRDDGTELAGNYLDGRPLNEGFRENIEYLKLEFLDHHDVCRGDKFEAILPILRLIAGAVGKPQTARGYGKSFIPEHSPFAVLIQEDHFLTFRKEIRRRDDISHVFLVTDSVESFREMAGQLPGRQCVQLYRSYLGNFKINMERTL